MILLSHFGSVLRALRVLLKKRGNKNIPAVVFALSESLVFLSFLFYLFDFLKEIGGEYKVI